MSHIQSHEAVFFAVVAVVAVISLAGIVRGRWK